MRARRMFSMGPWRNAAGTARGPAVAAIAVAWLASSLASGLTGCESNDDVLVLPDAASPEGGGGGGSGGGEGGAGGASDAARPGDAAVDAPSSAPEAAAEAAPSDATGGPPSDATTSSDAKPATDAAQGGGDELPPPIYALLRVANWSPDAPAVDFCIAPHGTGAFRGPVLAGLVAAAVDAGVPFDAGTSGLASGYASSYALWAPGQYDARLVVGSGCSAAITADATGLPAVRAGGSMTIALVGSAAAGASGQGLQVVGFLDDVAPAGAIGLRVINAAPGVPSVDVGTGSGSTFSLLFGGVLFGKASAASQVPSVDGSAPAVDSAGYRSQAALSGATVTAYPHGSTDAGALLFTAHNVFAAAGSVVSLVVTGGTSSVPLGLLECVDNAGSVQPIGNCSPISP